MTNHPSDEQVDRLLGDYFKAQLPKPWPGAPRTDRVQPAVARTADPAARSRWALAASVAVLVGGCWYLSGPFDGGKGRKGVGLEGGSADSKAVLKALAEPKTESKVGMP
ncbi:MAG TPA: hypothetical protein VM597_19165 [Gemmataceae bacterium]|jgi:hypothetical protein|nr:hypothetical protein [Gemmataceae bacterium]